MSSKTTKSYYLSEDLAERIEAKAEDQRRSTSNFVEIALTDYLDRLDATTETERAASRAKAAQS